MDITSAALKECLGFVPKGISRADAEDFFVNDIEMFKAGVKFVLNGCKSMRVTDDTEWADVDSFIHKNVSGESIILVLQ